MAKQVKDINKFSFAQMTSNADGKTSASGTMGIFIILTGGITFFLGSLGMIFKATDSNILIQSIAMVYAGALLLGYRKSKDTAVEEEEIAAKVECTCPEGCKCGNCDRCK